MKEYLIRFLRVTWILYAAWVLFLIIMLITEKHVDYVGYVLLALFPVGLIVLVQYTILGVLNPVDLYKKASQPTD
jgi:hypothetical protein